MSIGFMQNIERIIMHVSVHIFRNIGFYALFTQKMLFSVVFLSKNLGSELKISQTYERISP